MNLMTVTPPIDQRVARLIDANLDRTREGLRVIEDWCRFGLDRRDLVIKIKNWRHVLAAHHHDIYKNARAASSDQGALLNHPEQENRDTTQSVITANCSRAQEGLRVLEEFSRKTDPELAKSASIIRYALYELEQTILKVKYKKNRVEKLKSCKICLITSPESELLKTVHDAVKSGVKIIQFRGKDGTDQENFMQSKELASICTKNDCLFIINDRIDLALAVEADGVHLGQNDIPTNIARKLLGPEKLIGRSTHSLMQLHSAEEEGCDYIGIGPVYKTKTKPEANPIDFQDLLEVTRSSSLPYFAIGGINNANLHEITSIGINRIAVSSAIMKSKNPSLTTKEIIKKLS
tara:strand:+ start:1100 stop:2146 length:1047 start_codon:yes stop_codon:yes gene_type:complete